MAALNVRELGDFIRDQRRTAQISLRQLAKQAGVSNPYLSQIERGLRKPSAEILQQIAKALRISAEVLYVQAGILEEREGGEDVHAAVLADEFLTARQKQVVLDIYDAFRRENAVAGADGAYDLDLGEFSAAATSPASATPKPPTAPAPATAAGATIAAGATRPAGTSGGTASTEKTAAAGQSATAARPRRSAAGGGAWSTTSSGEPKTRATARKPRAASTGDAGAAKPARRATTRRTTSGRTTAGRAGTVAAADAADGPAASNEPSGAAGPSGPAAPAAPQP
jgi:transcriptional regulator with XRE-family HTH domain